MRRGLTRGDSVTVRQGTTSDAGDEARASVPVREAGAARVRRHGRGLPGDRREPRAGGCREGALGALRVRRRAPCALPARGPHGGEPLGRAERDRDPRRRGDAPEAAVHRDGARARGHGRRPAATRARPRRAGARVARAGGRGARPGTRARDRPPRRQAGEPARRRRRRDPRLGLRDRPRRRERHADDRRDGARLVGLHGARAGARRGDDRRERPLRARVRRVRAALRPAAVRPRQSHRRGARPRDRGAAVAARVRRVAACGARRGLRASAREAARGPLRELHRIRRRPPPHPRARDHGHRAARPPRRSSPGRRPRRPQPPR